MVMHLFSLRVLASRANVSPSTNTGTIVYGDSRTEKYEFLRI